MDALSGKIVDVHSKIFTALSRTIKDAYHLPLLGYTVRTEGAPPTGNSTYDTNYDYLGYVYGYYNSKYFRDSIDGNGLGLVSTVNFRQDPYNGYDNAFWSSDYQQMFFGDGDVYFANLVFALDVAGHELTHGVTEYESGLIYANEPGALNEAISDIFGAAVETFARSPQVIDYKTWECAEDIWIGSGSAARYMDNPTADGLSKDYYPERGVLSPSDVPDPYANDWGYIHANSGIANLAFKLMVTGGQHPRQGQYSPATGGYVPSTNLSRLGTTELSSMDMAERIFYQANTYYLGPGAQFMDIRAATVQSALDLSYGSTVASSVSAAWDVVGVPTFSNRNPINFSTRANVGTGANIMITGFVLAGGGSAKTLLLRAVGPTLATLGVTGTLGNPQMNLFNSGGTNIGYNDDWSSGGNATAIATAASSVGAFALPNPSYDSALLPSLSAGVYSMQINGVSGGTGIAMAEVYDTDSSNPNHLVNISTRCHVGTGSDIAIGGFVISGSGNKYLLIRGVGPTLTTLGLSGALSDPKIELYNSSGTKVRENDDWQFDENGNDLSSEITDVGAHVGAFNLASINSKDSALLVSLPAGVYSIRLSGVSGGTGIALLEVYEVD